MKKVVLIYGSIAGGIVGAFIFLTLPLFENGTLHFNSLLAGYSVMVIALSLVFFGVKSYRDNYLGGTITFGNALKVGLLISLVAALVYATGWEVNLRFFIPDFADSYAEHAITKLKANGATAEELQKATEKLDNLKAIYKKPILRFGMTVMEMLPPGIVIPFLCAAFLRRKEVLPTE